MPALVLRQGRISEEQAGEADVYPLLRLVNGRLRAGGPGANLYCVGGRTTQLLCAGDWDSGASLWDAGATRWDKGDWDSGASLWDAGATRWDKGDWDSGASLWDAGATHWS